MPTIVVPYFHRRAVIQEFGLYPDLVEKLCCPECRGPLSLQGATLGHPNGQVESGSLRCNRCHSDYPIVRGIPRFVPAEGYVSSFGHQWTRYAVERQEEDEAVFEVKTDFSLSDLRDRTLVDAGCGGGRYSLVAARHGARVIAIDMSRAIDRAAQLCREHHHAHFIQADLLKLPLAGQVADLAFSMGVLHHSSDASKGFYNVAEAVKVGGRFAVWLYRRNTAAQECVNNLLRRMARRMNTTQLESFAVAGAVLGSIPVINQTLNKIFNFSNHPVWANRVCDTFDWYSPRFQSHHTITELEQWFRAAGFDELKVLPPEKQGKFYRWVYKHNLIIGSGVNVVGTKNSHISHLPQIAHYNSSLEFVEQPAVL